MHNEKKKKVVPTLQQEVKVKADIVTSDDIKIYYTGKFQDFTAWYIINRICDFVNQLLLSPRNKYLRQLLYVYSLFTKADYE